MGDLERAYVDACVFVTVFTRAAGEPRERLEPSVWLLQQGQAGAVALVTSLLTIPEVLGAGPVRGVHVESRERRRRSDAAQAYFRDNDLLLVEVTEKVARAAGDLAARHQLKGGDAVHLASAPLSGCRRLPTWDDDLLKLGTLDELVVARPQVVGQAPLPGIPGGA